MKLPGTRDIAMNEMNVIPSIIGIMMRIRLIRNRAIISLTICDVGS